jgi:hypothetical protein
MEVLKGVSKLLVNNHELKIVTACYHRLVGELKVLNVNPNFYKEFAEQNRLVENEAGVVNECFINLERKIKVLIN